MKLYYNKSADADLEIRDRMKSMSLGFETEETTELEVKLVDGKEEFLGESAIANHLDVVAGELHSWYYCNC